MLKIAMKPDKRKMFTVKVNKQERASLEEKAKKYTQGNVSAWIRYAALSHVPDKKELT